VKIVCNSSVLITLENAGVLHVLKDLFKEILVKPLLDEIINHGFRITDELYQEILIKADEA